MGVRNGTGEVERGLRALARPRSPSQDGETRSIEAKLGDTLMEIALDNDLELECATYRASIAPHKRALYSWYGGFAATPTDHQRRPTCPQRSRRIQKP